ncbi:MAG: response regulator [Theionarchaea archaeon]|nr:response regulator [Theionarchaea archaeon]MBU6999167.1 response regulator [Theionarchaea archaeon]MBU7019526.1 response regulator [Theionarchaea archaeon]MBU7036207.1 response regulator [Theionarchaea archaeon]MBU7040951.1 response regulator [Theionarchaea archaeon]
MERLLVVDDDEGQLEVLKDILEACKYEVFTARSREEALADLKDHTFDLALVDLKLQDGSGFDIIEYVVNNGPQTVVLVLTGHASLDSSIRALRMGAYDFLQKPINTEILLKAVERGLEKKQLKDLAESVIKKMEEGLAVLNYEGMINFTNEQFYTMLRYSYRDLVGKCFLSLVAPEDEGSTRAYMVLAKQEKPQKFQAMLICEDGTELVGIISFTVIGDRMLCVVSDITQVVAPEITRENLTFEIEPGIVYLVEEETPESAMTSFVELVDAGLKGTMITREYPDKIRKRWGDNFQVVRLTEDVTGEITLFPNVTFFAKRIESYLSQSRVILIDRLDYVISNSTFDLVLKSLQKVRDMAFARKSIVILSIDPRTLTEKELSLLEKETNPLEAVARTELREDLMQLLGYVSKRNEVGTTPHHRDIQKKFNISRSTVRERLNLLSSKGLIVEKRDGRRKVIQITERGRKLTHT